MNILTTERLMFRTWAPEDLELGIRLWGNPAVMTYLSVQGALTNEQITKKIAAEIECQQKHHLQYWPFFDQKSRAFIGCCGLKPWSYTSHGGYELGFHLVEEAWGKGYAVEAAHGVIDYAKKHGLKPLMAGHHPQNFGSKKALARLGFKFVEDVFFPPTGLMHPSYILEV